MWCSLWLAAPVHLRRITVQLCFQRKGSISFSLFPPWDLPVFLSAPREWGKRSESPLSVSLTPPVFSFPSRLQAASVASLNHALSVTNAAWGELCPNNSLKAGPHRRGWANNPERAHTHFSLETLLPAVSLGTFREGRFSLPFQRSSYRSLPQISPRSTHTSPRSKTIPGITNCPFQWLNWSRINHSLWDATLINLSSSRQFKHTAFSLVTGRCSLLFNPLFWKAVTKTEKGLNLAGTF